MRSLIFNLNVNVPKNSGRARNLAIMTHQSAQLLIRSGVPTVLNVTDDNLSDSELLEWYKKRYAGFGLGVTIKSDANVAVSAPKAEAVSEIKVEAEEVKVDAAEPVETATVEKEPVDAPESFEEEVEKKADPKKKSSVKKKNPVDNMTYFEMVQFAKDHEIKVDGRGKDLYVKALKKWFKENPN